MPAVPDDKKRPKKCPFRVRKVENCLAVFYTAHGAKKKYLRDILKYVRPVSKYVRHILKHLQNRMKTRQENTDSGRRGFPTIPLLLNYTESALNPAANFNAFPCGRQVICRLLPPRCRGRGGLCRQGRRGSFRISPFRCARHRLCGTQGFLSRPT